MKYRLLTGFLFLNLSCLSVAQTPLGTTQQVTNQQVTNQQVNIVQPGKQPARLRLYYPEKAYKNNIQGIVKLQVFFDQNCQITRVTLIEGIGHGCDEAAIECVKVNHHYFEEWVRAKAKRLARSPIDCECEHHSAQISIRFIIPKQ